MRFAVDIDNTVTEWADKFRPMMRLFKEGGHDVYMLTGGMDQVTASEPYRIRQLRDLGVMKGIHYDDIHICISDSYKGVAALKAKFCKEMKIDVVFDDMEIYTDAIRKESPDTMALRVMP